MTQKISRACFSVISKSNGQFRTGDLFRVHPSSHPMTVELPVTLNYFAAGDQ